MTITAQLLRKFTDFVYRHAYAEEYLDSAISTQIKVLREQRGLTQIEFADLLGMKQSQIARMESVNHSGWQLRTLKRVAKALDLFLVVKFESFGAVLPDIENFGRAALERPSFKDDPVFSSTMIETSAHLGDSPLPTADGVSVRNTAPTRTTQSESQFAMKSHANAA